MTLDIIFDKWPGTTAIVTGHVRYTSVTLTHPTGTRVTACGTTPIQALLLAFKAMHRHHQD